LAAGWASCTSRVSILQARVLNHDLQHNKHAGGFTNAFSSLLLYTLLFHPHFRLRDLLLPTVFHLSLAPSAHATACIVITSSWRHPGNNMDGVEGRPLRGLAVNAVGSILI
jgi:hypothetical protein